MRGGLFIKIFLGFWLITLATVISTSLIARYIDRQTHLEVPHAAVPPRQFPARLLYAMQNTSREELQQLISQVEKRFDVTVYLIAPDGQDIFQRQFNDEVRKAADSMTRFRRRYNSSEHGAHIRGHVIYRPGEGLLRAVLVRTTDKPPFLGAFEHNIWLRILLAVVISGLVCFVLSRLLTHRLQRLQVASRKLAGGNLDARIDVRDSGGDETDELARDFNTMAEQLSDYVQAHKRLLHDVSHELRSPLARLRLALALAVKDDSNRAEHFKRIEEETERLDELIGQLLESPDSGLTLDEHLDLRGLLEQLCADCAFEGENEGKSAILETSLEHALVASRGDFLMKAFDNILRNAIRYTKTNTTVKVGLSATSDHYVVHIQDYGPGVPEVALKKMFDEFYRVDTARTRDSGGYGLGLAIARRAVALHKGDISAFNNADGLVVEVTLPRADDLGLDLLEDIG